jgi:hypothetical protein
MSEGVQRPLLAGQLWELEWLQLQSQVWESSGPALFAQLPKGAGQRALDVGGGILGWLRPLSERVWPTGQVLGSDIAESILTGTWAFVDQEARSNVTLVRDDLFATQLPPDAFDAVGASVPAAAGTICHILGGALIVALAIFLVVRLINRLY